VAKFLVDSNTRGKKLYPIDEIDFRYTDLQWKEIEAELRPSLRAKYVRFELELACNRYLKSLRSGPPDNAQRRKLWLKQLSLARKMIATWPDDWAQWSDFTVVETDLRDPALQELHSLLKEIEKRVEYYDQRVRKGPRLIERDVLISFFIQYWSRELGNPIGASVSSTDGEASGPLLRFLMAGANPVLEKPMSKHACRAVIRKLKPWFGMFRR
jgi:hypothetical protein